MRIFAEMAARAMTSSWGGNERPARPPSFVSEARGTASRPSPTKTIRPGWISRVIISANPRAARPIFSKSSRVRACASPSRSSATNSE